MDWYDVKEWCREALWVLGAIMVVILVVAVIVAACSAIAAPISRQCCINTGDVMGVDVEWRFFGGCFLELDGQMLPEDRWHYIKFGVPVE